MGGKADSDSALTRYSEIYIKNVYSQTAPVNISHITSDNQSSNQYRKSDCKLRGQATERKCQASPYAIPPRGHRPPRTARGRVIRLNLRPCRSQPVASRRGHRDRDCHRRPPPLKPPRTPHAGVSGSRNSNHLKAEPGRNRKPVLPLTGARAGGAPGIDDSGGRKDLKGILQRCRAKKTGTEDGPPYLWAGVAALAIGILYTVTTGRCDDCASDRIESVQ